MIVLEWLFLTISPCAAAEPWQLGFQDAATPMMQGIIDLHYDIFFFLILILVFGSVIFLMEGQGKNTVATTSAGAVGDNADDDDERKREREREKAFRILQILKSQKGISNFLHDQVNHPFPRSPSKKDWFNVTKIVCDALYPNPQFEAILSIRLACINALFTKLTMEKSDCQHFPQFIEEMRKYLEEN